MAYKRIKVKLTGVQPLMLNNIQTANPLNKWARMLKEVTGKKKKTDADTIEIIRLQFMASWYIDEEGRYVLPSENVLKSFEAGAKEFKKGTLFKENCQIMEDNLVIQFDGKDKSLEELYDDGNGKYVDTRICGISSGFGSKAKVLATRAIIDKWSVTFTLLYNEDMINLEDVKRAADNAGERKGVGTYRSRYGRFNVEFIK